MSETASFLEILGMSLIIGGLCGFGLGAGAARMFHAPTVQGMGHSVHLGNLMPVKEIPHLTSHSV